MLKFFRRLNKYERAYLKKTQKKNKRSLFKKILNKHILLKKVIMLDIKKTQHNKKRIVIKTIKNLKKNKNRKKLGFISFLKKVIGFFILIILIILSGLFLWFSSLEIPDVNNFDKRKISNSTKIYDKTGEILLYDIHENIQRTVVSGDQISQSAKEAIISIEDHSFYEHNGVVWKSTIRAGLKSILSKTGVLKTGSPGGSTLTQQVVKNTLLTREKTLPRKMKEWVLAYKIEKKLSKDEILTIYLNEAPYGGTIYGIQEASRVFFGKTALELTIAESAYLAAIPNLPTFYSPYGQNKDKLYKRQRVVLSEMKKYGYISDKTYREALEEEVSFLPQEENYAKALHFVQYVRSILEEKYGVDVVENGGLKVITTLDYKLQQKAEEIIKRHIEDVEGLYDASNAALVSIDVETGNIITMVGSRDYFDTDGFDGNFNVAIASRQPGSAFKPIAYGAVFEKGYLPESIVFDTETQFNSSCEIDDTTSDDGCYSPNNYDFKFEGALTFRNALAQSRNIAAIKILHLAGLSNVIETAKEMGISSLTESPSYYGLGLVLGGGEVSLLELVSAYTTFPNDGEYNKTNAILEVVDVDGVVLEKYQKNEERIFSKNTARMVSSVLSDNVARTPLFGAQSFLYFGSKDIAGKTGTTNDNRDAWLIGYSSDIAVGVWTGNNDNSPMKKGSSISGKPWREFMNEALEYYDDENFKEYDLPEDFGALPNMIRGEWFGDKTYYINSVSGKLATEFTPDDVKISVTNFEPHTILYSVRKNKPQETGNSRNDAQYPAWEYGVQKYVKENYQEFKNQNLIIPTEYDDINVGDELNSEDSFSFNIDGLDSVYLMDSTVNIEIDLDGIHRREIESILYYINNSFAGSIDVFPFVFGFDVASIQYLSEENTLRVVVNSKEGDTVSKEESFGVVLPEDLN